MENSVFGRYSSIAHIGAFTYVASQACSYLAGDAAVSEPLSALMLSPDARAVAASTVVAVVMLLFQGLRDMVMGQQSDEICFVAIPLAALYLWGEVVFPEIWALGLDFSAADREQSILGLFKPVIDQLVTPVAYAILSGVGAYVSAEQWGRRWPLVLVGGAASLFASFILIFSRAPETAENAQ